MGNDDYTDREGAYPEADPRDALEPHSVLDSTADDGRETVAAQTVQTWAKEAASYFTTTTRDNGEVITITTDGRPDWLTNLIRRAHDDGDMLPDDYRYSVISEALDKLADLDEDDDPDEAADEFADDVDVYTSELTGWLHSRNDRSAYVDDARKEYGPGEDLDHDLMRGQAMERREVFQSVRESLLSLVELTTPDDEDESNG